MGNKVSEAIQLAKSTKDLDLSYQELKTVPSAVGLS
jgi:hypothetical protein